MSTILLFDASKSSRERVANSLRAASEWDVHSVATLAQVAERYQLHPVDVIVSDLFDESTTADCSWASRTERDLVDAVAEMVNRLQAAAPGVPVIVLTDRGHEACAVAAIRAGAVDYLRKSNDSSTLLASIERAIELNTASRAESYVRSLLVQQTTDFCVPCDRTQMPLLARHLVQMGVAGGVLETADRVRVTVALEEALVNAVVHGNLEVSSKLREMDGDSYEKLISLRERVRPFCDRVVKVRCELSTDTVRYSITDQGPGFDVSKLPDPLSQESLLKPSGRGILLMRAFMDEVQHSASGNQVTLMKRRTVETTSPTMINAEAGRTVVVAEGADALSESTFASPQSSPGVNDAVGELLQTSW